MCALSRNRELIDLAKPVDWRYVRLMTSLTRQQLYQYRKGYSSKHIVQIEQTLMKSIKKRMKIEQLHIESVRMFVALLKRTELVKSLLNGKYNKQ